MPEKTAIIQGKRLVSYGELDRMVERLSSFLLRMGVQKGDRIGILSKNSPEYIAAYIGVQRAGGVAVDINYRDSVREIKNIINHCSISALIVENACADEVLEALEGSPTVRSVIGIERRARGGKAVQGRVPVNVRYELFGDIVGCDQGAPSPPFIGESDLASIIYTSGTTGKPKGVMLTHGNFLANARSIIEYLGLDEDDRVMVVLPFCYSYGKSLMTTHLMAGGSMVLENSFMYPHTVFTKMVDESVTGFAGVPSTFAIILNRSNFREFRFPRLRYVTQAGGPMPPQHARELSTILPATKIYIMYGQTEATARLTYLHPDEILSRPGSIGKPIPGVEIDVVHDHGMPLEADQEGEIVARGCNIMAGYWDDPEETMKVLRNGCLYTGDLGKKDKDGYLYIVGRRSDMIKSGAHRISPQEIEEVVHELDEVHEVSVVGIPDEILGEAIRAVVVLKEGRALDAKGVLRHCQARLALFKIPKEVLFVDALPKTNTGKTMRYMLKGCAALFSAKGATTAMP